MLSDSLGSMKKTKEELTGIKEEDFIKTGDLIDKKQTSAKFGNYIDEK